MSSQGQEAAIGSSRCEQVKVIIKQRPSISLTQVHIHGSDMESLYKQVPREMLPVEYGGTNGTVEEIKSTRPALIHIHRRIIAESLSIANRFSALKNPR